MVYEHKVKHNNEIRICTQCNKEFPNTNEYFSYANKKTGKLRSICKECSKIISKNYREKNIESNKNKDLFYDGTRKCKKCGRELPNNKLYFSIDLACLDGLRNVCRECSKKESGFLEPDYLNYEKWSNEDLELLKNIYSDYTEKELAEQFFTNRTIYAIKTRANILGVSWKTDETKQREIEQQSEIVSELFAERTMKPELREKISKAKKEYYKTHDSWWKGKKRSKKQREQMSKRRKEQGAWKGSSNPRHIDPLCGELNGRWKGGILDFYKELRSDTKDWFKQSMEFCGYKCVITGGEFDNCHHTTSFSNIVEETFELSKLDRREKVADYATEEFDLLREILKALHVQYGYGACVNKNVHKLFHDTYGYKNFSPYDFLDFCHKIESGELDNWFVENNLEINLNYKYIKYLEDLLYNFDTEEQVG